MKYLNVILILWCSIVNLGAQTTTENYVLTKTYTEDDGSTGITQIQYFDGLGRPIETVMKAFTPTGKDLVSTIVYDGTGREWQHWLPAPSTNSDGSYVDVASFNTPKNIYNNDTNPYTQTNYERSPLNRVTGQLGAGELWHNAQKKDSLIYCTNTSGEVHYFYVNNANHLVRDGSYNTSTLYKTIAIDADGLTTTEYKDKLGRVVMKRNGSNVNTAFVYNDLNQLSYVLPPAAYDLLTTNGTITDNHDALKKYGFLYKYDERGNCIYKRLPGCAPIFMLYDKTNRLVLSQDGNQRSYNPKKWTTTHYDSFGRIVVTSEISSEISDLEQSEIKNQLWVCDFNSQSNFENGYFSSILTTTKFLIINYYDDYRFLLKEDNTTKIKLSYAEESQYGQQHSSAKGLLTGTRIYLLDGSGQYTITALYYDDRGQVVQTRSTNHLGGYEISYNLYTFNGQLKQTLKEHNIASQSVVKEKYVYDYDHAGRLLKTKHQLNNKPEVAINDMTEVGSYDEIGRLKKKRRHSINNQSFADSEEFDYSIRNQPTMIKSGTFEQKLYYNTNLPSYGVASYNGNIAYSTWTYNGSTKGYLYYYDNLNRLNHAAHTLNGNTQYAYNEYFDYDKMGNIQYLERSSDGYTIDYLNFSYHGNQVTAIMDDYATMGLYSIKEYQDKSYSNQNEMAYDSVGNLTKDLDRDIVTIKYNMLNLPEIIQFKNGNQILNSYDAGGRKLAMIYRTVNYQLPQPLNPGDVIYESYDEDVMVEGTAYVDNVEYNTWSTGFDANDQRIYEYENAKIHFIEGYVCGYSLNNTTPNYYYYRRDHLGNNREVWLASYSSGGQSQATTVQRTQYYPSGLPWKTVDNDYSDTQNRKYNGKEFVEMHGLDEYDSEARWYYPAIMRTTTIDPHCENYYDTSPYAWCANNPVNAFDPNGMDWYSYKEEYTDEEDNTQTRTAYKYVEGEMSEDEMQEGGYTHLGKTYDDGNGKYFSLGGSEIEYDINNTLSIIAINRIKGADNTIIATINAFSSAGNFWDNYNSLIGMGNNAATIIGEMMDLSKGFKGSMTALGILMASPQIYNDYRSFQNGTLNGVALSDAIVNIISIAGVPGAAISLYYNGVAKPGAKAIIKLDQALNDYILNLIIRSNNGMF